MSVARLFTHGGSQAVRLSKEFCFEGVEVDCAASARDRRHAGRQPHARVLARAGVARAELGGRGLSGE